MRIDEQAIDAITERIIGDAFKVQVPVQVLYDGVVVGESVGDLRIDFGKRVDVKRIAGAVLNPA